MSEIFFNKKSIDERWNMKMKLRYDGQIIGTVLTNHSMSVEDAIESLNIDANEMVDDNTPRYDYDLFSTDYSE